ncbi:MAG: energy transducer TonB [Deltaproteobacteria bacterium]|nr:energy transducer TonB [Deltaproteobacteria bacterium]
MSTPLENVAPWVLEAGWVVLAIVTHALFLGLMPDAPMGFGAEDPLNTVAIAIVEEDPVTPEPEEQSTEPEEPAEPEPVKPPPKPKTFKAPKEPPKAPEEPPAAAPETPVAFDNIVLTNDGDEPSSWAVDPGSGESSDKPIGRPDAVVTGRSRDGIVGGIVGGTGLGVVVDVGDLSRQPIPPSLKRKLEKLYPKKARQEGIEGEAVLRLQIAADGLPANIRIISEDPTGYELGRACMKTLQGEQWKPPIDKTGKPVTTRITYRCGFEIKY